MITTGPYVPVSGDTLTEVDPAKYTAASTSVQVQNQSEFSLAVTVGPQQFAIQPFTATTLPTDKASQLLIAVEVAPILGGSITLIWMQPGETPPIADGPLAGTSSTFTNQVFIKGPIAVVPGDTSSVDIAASWRSVWVVAAAAGVPTVKGDQSGATYQSFTPPYLAAPAVFYRFPLITGIDTSVTITWEHTGNAWYGADLASIDTVSYSSSGGP